MRTGEYLDLWLDTYVKPFRAPSTVACYRRAIEQLPASMMRMELNELNGIHIQSAINRKSVQHPRAAQLIYATLSVAMAKAVRLRLISSNPMEAVDKPPHKARKMATWTPEQLAQYLTAARASDHWPLLLLMATCGLRRGEALGITWAAIDGNVLHIRQQRQRVAGKGLQTRPLKSEASNRDIPLSAPILDELRAWPHRSLTGWVVDTTPDRLYKAHLRVIGWAQLPPIGLHGLRHTMAAAMAADGTPIKILQGILGHSHYQLTADLYADHLRVEIFRRDLERLSGRVLQSVNFQGAARL